MCACVCMAGWLTDTVLQDINLLHNPDFNYANGTVVRPQLYNKANTQIQTTVGRAHSLSLTNL